MKILHLCDSLNPAGLGGYESYLHYLSKHLVNRGDTSIVVTQAQRKNSPAFSDCEFYRVHFLSGNYLEARKWEFFSRPEKDRERKAREMFESNDLEKNIQVLERQLTELIREYRPNLIHAHSTYVVFNRVLSELQESGLLDDVPMIATIHGRPKPLILPNGKKTTDFESFSEACPFDLVLAVSENVAMVLDNHLSKNDVVVPVLPLYLGVDLEIFSPKPDTKKNWDVGFLGRLERMKAVDLFPEMVKLLSRDYPDLKFLVTGDGSLRSHLLNDFKEKRVTHLVEYLGVVETSQVPELINQSRVFIYPSREEPFGLSIVEAMGCGVPVVTTNVYGPKEIITNHIDGLTVSPDNITELVAAIKKLLDDKNLRRRIGMNGRRTVEKRFDIKTHLESLYGIYQDMVAEK